MAAAAARRWVEGGVTINQSCAGGDSVCVRLCYRRAIASERFVGSIGMRHGHAKAAALAASLIALLASCGQGNQYIEPPPPKVTVTTPVPRQVPRYLEATGNAAAVNSTDLVARVPGFVQQINQDDGKLVAMGALLYVIEPEPYQVKLEQAKAAEVGDEATLKQAETAFQRMAELLTRQTASQAQYDQAIATRDSAKANVDQARANTKLAQLNYDYTQVTAPFAGIVTARQVSLGQYVGGSAT